ncbi:MAG: roadblock/LC7 domain-containing protein, partial [Promethearchaeota archaeon]
MIDPRALKEIVKRFASREDVRGVIITDDEGLPIQSDVPTETTELVAAHVTSLVGRAKKVVDGLGEGNLHFIKIETDKGEVLVAPESEWILIVLQGAS